MRLEEAIKQKKPFDSELNKAVVNVVFTSNFFMDDMVRNLKEFDINDQHYNVLRILRGAYPGSLCPGEIKQVLLNKRGDLTRLIDKLVKLGYVNRDVNLENRRMVDISINKEGLNLLNTINKKFSKTNKYDNNLSEKEAKKLNALLDKLRG